MREKTGSSLPGRLAAIAGLTLLAACGSGTSASAECTSLRQQYATALAAAAACDPAAANACGPTRPAAGFDFQNRAFICPDCEAHVNAANVTQIDDLLARYDRAGCNAVEANPRACEGCAPFNGKAGSCTSGGICGP